MMERRNVEVVVVKLLVMLNTLFGRHRYQPPQPAGADPWKAAAVQASVLYEAERRASECLQDGEEKDLLTVEVRTLDLRLFGTLPLTSC